MMKTDEELAAEAQGLDESDDGLDDFNMDIGEVKQGNFEDIVANTQTKWAETEIEAKARVAEELHLSAESVREREAAGEKSDEARLHAAQQKFEATAALNESLLSSSYYNLIQPKYSEKPPQRQYNTPAFFPQVQHPSLSNPETFKNLTRDTLFFAFYYQQQTYQQYLAARQLKIDSWRYHKKENTWFQRAHKPTKTDDDYEIGTYYYFDYLQDWQCKNREFFRFDYVHLEDELNIPSIASSKTTKQNQATQPPNETNHDMSAAAASAAATAATTVASLASSTN
ncbi:General negative regulator of transcription subunit 3 [Diplonema papillatum]|nr:General negative regulator of transcription subunit 3 [Diplonema papillatum]